MVATGRQTVDDVKGVLTPDFRLKYKLFRHRYPEIELRIVDANDYRERRRTKGPR